jgi:hypothetical protein
MISFFIPLKTEGTNKQLRMNTFVRARRTKLEKEIAGLFPAWQLKPAVRILMTRLSSSGQLLDDDNLRGALKATRDGLALKLRINDATPLVKWDYAEERCERGKEGVRVEVLPP